MRNFDEQKAVAEMKGLAHEQLRVEVLGGELLVLISTLQLACRHPAFKGSTREIAVRVARNWQNLIADPGSEMWRALEAGWDPGQDAVTGSGAVGQSDSQSVSQSISKKPGRSGSTTSVEIGRGDVNMIGGMSKAIVATVNRWISEQGPVEFIDMFMALHNAHCAVIFDLEEKTGDSKGHLRKMAIDTMQERFEREPRHVAVGE